MGGEKFSYKFLFENLKERDCLVDLGMCGRKVIQLILKT
jgi:hypothetical protein